MKAIFTYVLIFAAFMLQAQTTADFEAFDLNEGEFLNGSTNTSNDPGFADGNVFLPNQFNDAYGSWTGWAISATTDVTTPGWGNQYSSITGGGYDDSETYAVSYIFGESRIRLTGAAAGGVVEGMYITNGTYAYLSMLEGDNIAKKFGGETGNDPDYFLLTIKKYYNGELSDESIEFYLADYRFEDNSQDYIVDEWTYLDLSSLGSVDSLSFTLSSSDVGMFGMNTPAYFCMDNITTQDIVSNVNELEPSISLSLYPNPAVDYIQIETAEAGNKTWGVYSISGELLESGEFYNEKQRISLAHLPNGSYFVKVLTEAGNATKALIIAGK